jgi:serine phosphatase RsbU (regulator of sigma subunit)/pSer/pThr/pTyr-binding forkhead associated (FHA) protein
MVAKASLRMIKGPQEGAKFHLDGEKCILGRHPECDIVLEVGAVSRQHAQVLRVGEEYFVEDLKSRNGTFVNDTQIAGRQKLHQNDQVKICDLVFAFDEGIGSSDQFLVDDAETATGSTIMSKLDVSTSYSAMRLAVNPEVKLRALLEITQSLAKSLELDEVLPKILDSLFKVFVQADRGFVVLQDVPGGPLIPKAVKYRRGDTDDTVRISRTIVNEALKSRQAILSADAASDSRFGMSESIADFRIRSMMCAPMIDSEGRPLGIIQIDTLDQRSRFQQDDLEVLAAVAAQSAFAIENATLHANSVAQERTNRDLELARRVQQGFLPHEPPHFPGYEFFDFYVPAQQVGGDYYDYLRLPDNRLAVIVADVSGKGIPAALMMARISAEFRYWLASERNAARAVTQMNQAFSRQVLDDKFVTAVLLLMDATDHSVTIVNAGHMPPLLRRADSTVEEVGDAQAGVPLGIDGDFEFESCTIQLAPGESLTAYTDGISEAMNVSGEIYSNERIRGQLTASQEPAVAALGKLVLDDVKRFVGKHYQSDDMCLVCFARLPE